MSRKKSSSRGGRQRKPATKTMLLPMPRASANEVSLGNHVALSACLSGTGNAHQISELARALYLAFYLQQAGYGNAPMDLYKKGEALLEAAVSRAETDGVWEMAPEAAQILGDILHLHDAQLRSAPTRSLVDAGARLARFRQSEARSPLPDEDAWRNASFGSDGIV